MSTFRRPAGRYDEPKPVSRAVKVMGASVGALALVVFAYLGYSRFSDGRAQFGVTGYTVLDDANVRVRFEVHKDVTTTITCAVVARDRNNDTVGHKDVVVGPSERDTVEVSADLTTTSRAATAEVSACSRPSSP